MTRSNTTLALSIGCPSGIGPEVAARAAIDAAPSRLMLVGDLEVVRRAARLVGAEPAAFVPVTTRRELATLGGRVGVFAGSTPIAPKDAPFGAPTRAGGRAQLAWIDEATDLVRAGVADALVTGPVSKHAIATSGAGAAAARFLGHTEHLERRLGAREVVMAFFSDELAISLVTTHLALRDVPRAITRAAVASAAFHTTTFAHALGARAPRIAVTSLNPHAGEGGLLGGEERSRIAPGIALARARLVDARVRASLEGPIGAESAIRLARAGRYDAVVAMYHDQATIPMKLVGFGESVNVTLGLPIVRTSVDHGTGHDIAGRGVADPRGMTAAIALARRLVR